MRPIFFCTLVIPLLMAKLSVADVAVAAPAGDADPAFLADLQASLEEVAGEAALPEGESAELRASANAAVEGVALEVALIPADGSEPIREARTASPASALAQARAMARSVITEHAERLRSQAGPAAPVKETAAAAPAPSPIDLARTAARPGIAAGLALDIAGFTGFAVALIVGFADDESVDAMLVTMGVSGGAVALGSLVSTSAYTARHVAYLRAGLRPLPYKLAFGWVHTAATAVLYGLSVRALAEYLAAVREADPDAELGEGLGAALDQFGWGLAFVFYSATSLLVEAINLGVVRTLWRRDFRKSERAPRPTVAIAPFVAPGGSRSASPVAGLAAAVQF